MSLKANLLLLFVGATAPLYSAEVTGPIVACCCLNIYKGSIPLRLRTHEQWMLNARIANGSKGNGAILVDLNKKDPISGKRFGKLMQEYAKRSEQFTVALVSEVEAGQQNATIQIYDADALYASLAELSQCPVALKVRKFIEFGLKDNGVFEYVGTERFKFAH